MASKELTEDFRGTDPGVYDDLTGTASGPAVGLTLGSQAWQEFDESFSDVAGAFRCTATGTTVAPPPPGQGRYAKLTLSGLSHTADVTTFEARVVPGMAMTGQLDSGFEQFGLSVTLTGEGTVEWNFAAIHTFTGTAPGALVTLRVEITNTQARFYVDGVLKYTRASGVAYSASIDSVQLEMPGAYHAHGRSVGVAALALDALKIKTEAVSGSLLPPTEAEQPEATDDPDFRVLFSDTFGTLRALHGSHGETGPLGMSEWAEAAIRDNVFEYEEIVASGNWTRTDGDGLFVEGVDRGEFIESSASASLDFVTGGGPDGGATTKLPCVLECRLFSRGLFFIYLKRSPTYSDVYYAAYGFYLHLHNDGTLKLAALGEDNTVNLPFAAPPPTATDGVLCRLEVWPDHVRAYANGSLVGYIEVDVAERVNNPSGECVITAAGISRSAFDYSVEPGRAVFVGVTPAGSSVRLTNLFKLSGVQDSAGPLPAIPPNTEDGSLPPVPGPDNEPSRTDNYTSFWTNFNATYEVP